MADHWVVVTTGGTQRYIFNSNRRKLNVGASYLVAQLPTWVSAAIADVAPGLVPVVNVSGVANLLVSDPAVGRALIAHITRTALSKAPGLQVWGSIHAIEGDGHAIALSSAYLAHEQVRATLPPTTARFVGLPFTARDRFTGLPCSAQVRNVANGPDDPSTLAVSTVAERQWVASWDALRSVGASEGDDGVDVLRRAILPTGKLDQPLGNVWSAVVHADGNGFGQLLMELGHENSGPEFADELRKFSRALASVSYAAVRAAIVDITTRFDVKRHWILPLVVGGDDLTAVVDVRYARAFVESYLSEFQNQTSAHDDINVLALEVLGRDYLTVGAGIAIVKPTHPFHGAYTLAEELARSAKVDKTVSGYDVQVFHESVGRSLSDIRGDLTYDGGTLYGDPVALPAPGDSGVPSRIDAVIGDYALLSSGERHRLRAALTDLCHVSDAHMAWTASRDALLARVAAIHPESLGAAHALMDDGNLPYLIPALDLLDVEPSS